MRVLTVDLPAMRNLVCTCFAPIINGRTAEVAKTIGYSNPHTLLNAVDINNEKQLAAYRFFYQQYLDNDWTPTAVLLSQFGIGIYETEPIKKLDYKISMSNLLHFTSNLFYLVEKAQRPESEGGVTVTRNEKKDFSIPAHGVIRTCTQLIMEPVNETL